MSPKKSKWYYLGKFIKDGLTVPLKHPEFILYFLFVIIVLGGMGVWSTIFIESQDEIINHKNIILNISSYVVAILAAGSIELVFLDEENVRKPISLIAFISIIAGVFLLFISYISCTKFGYIFSSIGVAIALFIWWIGNSRNSKLTDNYFENRSIRTQNLGNQLNDYEIQQG